MSAGDVVRIGQGKAQWRITGFWHHGQTRMARLQRVDRQWITTSSTLDRLSLVEGAS